MDPQTVLIHPVHCVTDSYSKWSPALVDPQEQYCTKLPPGGRMAGQMPSTISQDLLSASVGGATNGDDILNSTSSTTNGGGGVSGHPESLCKSPSVVAMASASSPSALVTTPLMNFYDASATSGGGNTYISHPHIGNASARAGGKSTSGENGGSSNHISRPFYRCSWQYWVILICALAFLLAVSFAVFFSENAKWLENRLHEKYAQDPAIFGLFDPHNPPQKIESNTQAKIHLESMGLWAGHWHIQSDLCTIYNITLTSELSSIGVFLRYSTMPTIVHYSHFDRILGRQLKADTVVKKDATDLPKEAFPSIPSAIHVKPNAPRTTGRVRCLKKGHWFISIVNDQPRTEDIVLSMAEIVMPRGCPNDCSNRGICSQGVCDCLNGLTGKDCSSVEDVPICSGHGEYRQGKCHCFPEWKGPECETLWSECPYPTCSGHGRCVTGECLCFDGFGGDACQFRICPPHNCSGNGICVDGVCRCFSSWGGNACDYREISDPSIGKIGFSSQSQQKDSSGNSPTPEPACSFNGYREPTTGHCHCFPGFEGTACEKDVTCASRCVNGVCTGDRRQLLSGGPALPGLLPAVATLHDPAVCFCNDGWRGINCDVPTCNAKCLLNGQCVNDTCVCNRGWTGANCNLSIYSHRAVHQCSTQDSSGGIMSVPWVVAAKGIVIKVKTVTISANVSPTEKGLHVRLLMKFPAMIEEMTIKVSSTSLNKSANFFLLHRLDGLIDCLDPDCCSTEHCEKLIRFQGNQQRVVEDARQSCAHSSEISALILSTKLSPPGSSFYDQLEFLLLRDLTTDKVDPRRVSVVRGVVRQWDSTPFWGCRVFDRLNPVIGSALTDKNGRFELVVDGGFLVQLEFIRHPTSRFTAQLDVYVPVNQIVNIGDFYLIDRSRFILSATSSSTPFKKRAFYDGAVTGVGGMLPASLIFGDLWIVGLLPSIDPESAVDFCPPDVHDISLLGGPKIEAKRGGDDDNDDGDDLVCFGSDGAVCVSRGGILFHRYALKPSRLHLVHSSDKTAKSSSFLVVRMLANDRAPPDRLNEVHLSVDVAGLQQSWRFEPVQGLEFTFVWNRTDGYNRSVYGTALARGELMHHLPWYPLDPLSSISRSDRILREDIITISVGFLYRQCTAVLWEHRVVHIDGNDITPTDLAGWNLDARHIFAPNQGIVYMSDGRRASVRDENLVVELILGKPNVRRLANRCEMCLGRARGNPIFRAAALATDETGRLLVSDGQFLRYLQEESHLQTLDSLNPSVNAPASITDSGSQSSSPSDWIVSDVRSMSFLNGGTGEEDWPAYFIARHPISSEELEALSRGGIGGGRAGIFISDARNRTIWWTSLARRDFSQMVISEQCSPNGTMSDCLRRSLMNPKGLVVTYNEDLFFIDDKQLWRYQLRNPPGQRSIRVELVIGQLGEIAVPMSCERSLPANKVQLVDPSFMAYNPVEDSIYYVDDKHVFRLHLASRMVSLAAGRLPGCKPHTSSSTIMTSTSSPTTSKAPFAVDVEFSEIRGIAFSSLGDLYIAESEVIWIRRSDGRLHLFAGSKSISAWDTPHITNSHLFRPVRKPLPYSQSALLTEHPALDFRFGNITSIAVGIFDEVFVSDVGHNVVFAVRPKPPRLGANEKYSIRRMASETQVFEKQGQLESVVDTLTQHRVSFFTFTGSGWLSAVRMGASDLSLRRSPLGFLQQVVLNTGETYNVTFALMNRGFGSIVTPFGSLNRYEYSDGGQMTKIWTISSALPYVASYSSTNGLLETIALPSGWLYPLQKTKGRKRGIDIFEDIKSRKVSMISSPHTEVIKLTYSGGAQEVVLERLEPPSNSLDSVENHASWQIGRRIRMYVQLQSPENLLSPNGNSLSTVDNTSAQMPRIIENLMMATFDVFGVISQDVETGGHFARKRRSSWFSSRSATSPFLGRGQRDIATDSTVQKTRKTLSINGQPVLSVTLDRESRTETFRSPSSDRLLLQIVYNTNMQPTVFATQPLGALPHSGFVDVSTGFIANTSRVNIQEPLIAPLRIIYTR
ncbi:Teneurin-1 [Echinococcus granulosus]|uniref:Teneurin-1 n=1 Tax=Echinococcus granulosus TaxID=6210 RepID=W6U5Z4_ECHGR|nr:Teneurin-1 [Echinococcus granulosus]EUB56535.1 Teneurin-1 [Echinococcus granulosus]